MTIQERSYRKEPRARGLVVGDFVREVDGDRVGMVVYLMDCGLVVVRWPPSREGIAYEAEDLVSVDDPSL
jgi:hypothetical protein